MIKKLMFLLLCIGMGSFSLFGMEGEKDAPYFSNRWHKIRAAKKDVQDRRQDLNLSEKLRALEVGIDLEIEEKDRAVITEFRELDAQEIELLKEIKKERRKTDRELEKTEDKTKLAIKIADLDRLITLVEETRNNELSVEDSAWENDLRIQEIVGSQPQEQRQLEEEGYHEAIARANANGSSYISAFAKPSEKNVESSVQTVSAQTLQKPKEQQAQPGRYITMPNARAHTAEQQGINANKEIYSIYCKNESKKDMWMRFRFGKDDDICFLQINGFEKNYQDINDAYANQEYKETFSIPAGASFKFVLDKNQWPLRMRTWRKDIEIPSGDKQGTTTYFRPTPDVDRVTGKSTSSVGNTQNSVSGIVESFEGVPYRDVKNKRAFFKITENGIIDATWAEDFDLKNDDLPVGVPEKYTKVFVGNPNIAQKKKRSTVKEVNAEPQGQTTGAGYVTRMPSKEEHEKKQAEMQQDSSSEVVTEAETGDAIKGVKVPINMAVQEIDTKNDDIVLTVQNRLVGDLDADAPEQMDTSIRLKYGYGMKPSKGYIMPSSVLEQKSCGELFLLHGDEDFDFQINNKDFPLNIKIWEKAKDQKPQYTLKAIADRRTKVLNNTPLEKKDTLAEKTIKSKKELLALLAQKGIACSPSINRFYIRLQPHCEKEKIIAIDARPSTQLMREVLGDSKTVSIVSQLKDKVIARIRYGQNPIKGRILMRDFMTHGQKTQMDYTVPEEKQEFFWLEENKPFTFYIDENCMPLEFRFWPEEYQKKLRPDLINFIDADEFCKMGVGVVSNDNLQNSIGHVVITKDDLNEMKNEAGYYLRIYKGYNGSVKVNGILPTDAVFKEAFSMGIAQDYDKLD